MSSRYNSPSISRAGYSEVDEWDFQSTICDSERSGYSYKKPVLLETEPVIPHCPKDPRSKAKYNIFSRLLFIWLEPLFFLGCRRELEQTDLYANPEEADSETLLKKFSHYWLKELERKEHGRKPRLWLALAKCIWWRLIVQGLSIVFEVAILITQSVILGYLSEYFSILEPTGEETRDAYLYAMGLVLMSLVVVVLHSHSFLMGQKMSMITRVITTTAIFKQVLSVSQASIGQVSIGHVVNLASNDVQRFDPAFPHLPYLWITPLHLIAFTYVVYQEVGWSVFLASGFVLLQIPLQIILARLFVYLRLKAALITDERIRTMNEVIAGIRVIKMYAWEYAFKAKVSQLRKKETLIIFKGALIRACNLAYMIVSISIIMWLVLSVHASTGGELSTKQVFTTLSLLTSLRLSSYFFVLAVLGFAEGKVAISRVQNFLELETLPQIAVENGKKFSDEVADVAHMNGTTPTADKTLNLGDVTPLLNGTGNHLLESTMSMKKSSTSDPLVHVQDIAVSWSYDQTKLVLCDISFEVNQDIPFLAVVGPVGTGKSTLLQCLLGELKPMDGHVQMIGHVSYASQEPWVFTGTLRDNILFGMPYIPDLYVSVIEACCLDEDFVELAQGDLTLVGERGVTLSGGQKARVNLARAIYRDADIYLLDDPLSAVDVSVATHLFDNCIRGILQDRLVILVTHQIQFALQADKILVIKEGYPEIYGSHEELLEQGIDPNYLLGLIRDEDEYDEAEREMFAYKLIYDAEPPSPTTISMMSLVDGTGRITPYSFGLDTPGTATPDSFTPITAPLALYGHSMSNISVASVEQTDSHNGLTSPNGLNFVPNFHQTNRTSPNGLNFGPNFNQTSRTLSPKFFKFPPPLNSDADPTSTLDSEITPHRPQQSPTVALPHEKLKLDPQSIKPKPMPAPLASLIRPHGKILPSPLVKPKPFSLISASPLVTPSQRGPSKGIQTSNLLAATSKKSPTIPRKDLLITSTVKPEPSTSPPAVYNVKKINLSSDANECSIPQKMPPPLTLPIATSQMSKFEGIGSLPSTPMVNASKPDLNPHVNQTNLKTSIPMTPPLAQSHKPLQLMHIPPKPQMTLAAGGKLPALSPLAVPQTKSMKTAPFSPAVAGANKNNVLSPLANPAVVCIPPTPPLVHTNKVSTPQLAQVTCADTEGSNVNTLHKTSIPSTPPLSRPCIANDKSTLAKPEVVCIPPTPPLVCGTTDSNVDTTETIGPDQHCDVNVQSTPCHTNIATSDVGPHSVPEVVCLPPTPPPSHITPGSKKPGSLLSPLALPDNQRNWQTNLAEISNDSSFQQSAPSVPLSPQVQRQYLNSRSPSVRTNATGLLLPPGTPRSRLSSPLSSRRARRTPTPSPVLSKKSFYQDEEILHSLVEPAPFDAASIYSGRSMVSLPGSTYKQKEVTNDQLPQDLKEQEELIQKSNSEKKSHGTISFKTYYDFFRAGGNLLLLIIVMVTFIMGEVSVVLSDWWLSDWADCSSILEFASDNDSLRSTCLLTSPQRIAIYSSTTLVAVILNFGRAILFYFLCLKASHVLHNRMFSSVLTSPLLFFDSNPIGRVLNRFSKDVGFLDDLLPYTFCEYLLLLLRCLAVIIMAAASNVWLLIPAGVLAMTFLALRWYYLRTGREIKRLEAIARSPVYSHISSTLVGLPTIRAFCKEQMVLKQFHKHQNDHSQAWYLYLVTVRWFGLRIDILSTLFLAAVALLSVPLASQLNAGLVGLGLTYTISLADMLQYTIRLSADVENTMISAERVMDYGRLESEAPLETLPPNEKPPSSWPDKGKVTFEDVAFQYSSDLPLVLKNLCVTIQPSEKVGIVGRTGAGKSSLISVLYRLAEPFGQITIDDVDTRAIGLHDLRKKMSIIPQDPVLFSGTMRYNLDPFDEYSDTELWDVLEQVQLKAAVQQLEGQLGCEVSEGGSNFSVGQRQLVCLARALLRKNKILVLDEATANVDQRTDEIIQKIIRNKFSDCTVLTIAHRLNTIMDSDKIMVLKKGKLKEFDSPYKLLQDPFSKFCKMVEKTGPVASGKLHQMALEAHLRKTFRRHGRITPLLAKLSGNNLLARSLAQKNSKGSGLIPGGLSRIQERRPSIISSSSFPCALNEVGTNINVNDPNLQSLRLPSDPNLTSSAPDWDEDKDDDTL